VPRAIAARWVRTVVTGVAVLVTLGTFLMVEGESVNARTPYALLVAAWWVSPLVAYHRGTRTLAGSVVIGGAILAAIVAFLLALYHDDSSTAAIGFFTIPVVLWVGTGLLVVVERRLVRRRR